MCSYYDHEGFKKYVVGLLKHYGFDTKPEVWISSMERIDVAGRCVRDDLCKGSSIGVEVSRTSDLAKDLDKLRKTNYDIKIVVLLKPYEKIPPKSGDIWIIRPEGVEHLLRHLLNIPMTYPSYLGGISKQKSIKEFIEKPQEKPLDKFKKYMGSPKLIEDSLRFILKAYALGEALFKTEYRPPYPSARASVSSYEDLRMVNMLERLGVIKIEGRGTYVDGTIFLASLTPHGKVLANEIAMEKMRENESRIKDKVYRYGAVIPFITSINCCIKVPKELKYEWTLSMASTTPPDKPWGASLDEKQKYHRALRLGVAPEAYMFAVNSHRLPRVLKRCIEFMAEFEDLRLSFKGGMYNSRGEYYGDKVCIVPELADHILNMTRDKALSKLDESGLVREFNTALATYIIGRRAHGGVTSQESLDRILIDLRVSYEDLRNFVEKMHDRGFTSKLLNRPPYIVVKDMEGFTKEIIEALKKVEDKMLRS